MSDERERRLNDLDNRLTEARARQNVKEGGKHVAHTDAGAAWRMIIELVTGMLVGFGIGYGLDYAFGTLPLFLVIFVLLGFAAGVRVMMQTAAEIQREQAARLKKDETHGG